MYWVTEPMLALELAGWSLAMTFCKVGVWLVWPVMQLVLNKRGDRS